MGILTNALLVYNSRVAQLYTLKHFTSLRLITLLMYCPSTAMCLHCLAVRYATPR